MPYNASVLEVMLAAPGDIKAELSAATSCIAEWNDLHSRTQGTVLLPKSWKTHSSPSMAGRPQEIINEQVLSDCDILVAIFWCRIGQPTGGFPSGTVEEIERTIQSGKPTLVYFSQAKISPGSVDPQQQHELRAFKNTCQTRGLYSEFKSLAEFRKLFQRHLTLTITRNFQRTVEQHSRGVVSADAMALLSEAVDGDGDLISVSDLSGPSIQANGREFVEPNNSRSGARWLAAFSELHELGLIRDLGSGEIFSVTDSGYSLADRKPKA